MKTLIALSLLICTTTTILLGDGTLKVCTICPGQPIHCT